MNALVPVAEPVQPFYVVIFAARDAHGDPVREIAQTWPECRSTAAIAPARGLAFERALFVDPDEDRVMDVTADVLGEERAGVPRRLLAAEGARSARRSASRRLSVRERIAALRNVPLPADVWRGRA